jgi:hypothetical protein
MKLEGKRMDPKRSMATDESFSGKTKKRMDQAEKVENRWIKTDQWYNGWIPLKIKFVRWMKLEG